MDGNLKFAVMTAVVALIGIAAFATLAIVYA